MKDFFKNLVSNRNHVYRRIRKQQVDDMRTTRCANVSPWEYQLEEQVKRAEDLAAAVLAHLGADEAQPWKPADSELLRALAYYSGHETSKG